MIGVTAAASTTIDYIGGFVNPILAVPVAIGVLIGAFAGTRRSSAPSQAMVRWLFVAVLIMIDRDGEH